MKPFHTYLTHDTTFHADEVFADALLRMNGSEHRTVRTRDKDQLAASLNDPSVLVADVGFQYDPEMNNFDHHQDLSLPSAAGLIWQEIGRELCPDDLEHEYMSNFIAAIDAVDTNRDNIYAQLRELPEGFRNASSLISGFNRDPRDPKTQMRQYRKAVDFAFDVLQNELESAKTYAASERAYQEREILPNGVAVFSEFSTIWKQKGEHQFAILPHASGWQLQSADTSKAVVPESVCNVPGFIFRHASGFMATSTNLVALIEFAHIEL